ncbi:MAG TPA: hypothetical protein VEX66_08970 [Microlunatus sp.]|jgi:hypothetical protein|nr:hypothetical protein [Microlunatus sp.]
MSRSLRRRPLMVLGIWLVGVALLALSGCNEVEEEPGSSYHPAELSSPGPQGVREVTLTEDAARRVGLQTSRVTVEGADRVVPYAALIYDEQGDPWVYTVPEPLTYVRVSVMVKEEVDEDTMALSAGPPVGTEVVTRGVAEVYGAELGMDGNH